MFSTAKNEAQGRPMSSPMMLSTSHECRLRHAAATCSSFPSAACSLESEYPLVCHVMLHGSVRTLRDTEQKLYPESVLRVLSVVLWSCCLWKLCKSLIATSKTWVSSFELLLCFRIRCRM